MVVSASRNNHGCNSSGTNSKCPLHRTCLSPPTSCMPDGNQYTARQALGKYCTLACTSPGSVHSRMRTLSHLRSCQTRLCRPFLPLPPLPIVGFLRLSQQCGRHQPDNQRKSKWSLALFLRTPAHLHSSNYQSRAAVRRIRTRVLHDTSHGTPLHTTLVLICFRSRGEDSCTFFAVSPEVLQLSPRCTSWCDQRCMSIFV